MDCCADNIEECCLPSETALPTSFPTAIPTRMCGDGRNYYYEIGRGDCVFYEKEKYGISYYTDHSLVCCSQNRKECCEVRDEYFYSALSSLGIIIIVFLYMFSKGLATSHVRIRPENEQ
jgi:hypothetical protein